MPYNELAHGQDACLNAKEIWQETISEKEKAEYAKAANDPVNHPSHYTDRVPGIECIEVVENFDFCLGGVDNWDWYEESMENCELPDEKSLAKYPIAPEELFNAQKPSA